MMDPRFDTACAGAAAPGRPSRTQLGLVSSSITISECRHPNGQHTAAIRGGDGGHGFLRDSNSHSPAGGRGDTLETLSQLERLLQ